ncbi:MAG: 2-oxoacid:acceptor oxidoreductase family protein [Peptococcaceae bacterium]|nr:2-oxoacid:acceptor oxidoreductase family protein [Peptococcaceae bacterium]
MEKSISIILAGSGGQGLGFGGRILAEAALAGGKNAAQSQSYGARARGGFSSSGVVIGEEEIVYPLVESPVYLVALSREGYEANRPLLAPGGLVIYDLDAVTPRGGPEERGYPIIQKAREINNEKGAALLALGILTGLTGVVNPAGVEAAIAAHFSGAAAEANRRAFQTGLALVRAGPGQK